MKKLLMVIFTENSSIGCSMLCYLARAFGWEADIYFVARNSQHDEQIYLFLEEYKPDLIGVSFKSWERSEALAFAQNARKFSNATIVAGGIHPTLMPEDIGQTGLFDAVVAGDGMGILKDILEHYRDFNGEIIHGKPCPDKSLYHRFYYSSSQIERMKTTETTTVLTALGCPYRCRFCHSGSMAFHPFTIEDVVWHMVWLNDSYGVRNFHILDDLFASNIQRLRHFGEMVEQRSADIGISSQVSGRASTFNRDIADELVKLGVETMNFGIETASPRLLKFLNKQQTMEDCYRTVEICHTAGLNCVVNLMFGIPTQDEKDYQYTLEFVAKTKPDSVNSFFYAPYPGTELYDYCFDQNYLPETYHRKRFDWFTPEDDGISKMQVRLSNVDYDLANDYIDKINQEINRDQTLYERMNLVDERPWVVVGTTRHFYYKTFLKKLARRKWKNCLGYLNTDTGAGFQLESEREFFVEYDLINGKLPFWCITYSFLGSDYKVLERYVRSRFGENMLLISLSSFRKSHTVEDVAKFFRERAEA